jgi:hypothetical protein
MYVQVAEEKATSIANGPNDLEAVVVELRAQMSRLEARCEVVRLACQFALPDTYNLCRPLQSLHHSHTPKHRLAIFDSCDSPKSYLPCMVFRVMRPGKCHTCLEQPLVVHESNTESESH